MGRLIQTKMIRVLGALALLATTTRYLVPAIQNSTPTPPPLSSDGRTLLNELAQVALDPQETFKVKEIDIDRASLHFTLHRGTLAFFTPVRGHVTGAVFVGDGEILVIPPNAIDRFQLNKFTDSPVLTERFSSAVFRFTDNTYQEITRTLRESKPPEPAGMMLRSAWDEAVRNLSQNLNYRILQNLLSSHPQPFFHASIHGEVHGWYEAVDDARAFEPILLGQTEREGDAIYPDIWCSFRPGLENPSAAASPRPVSDLYDILSVDVDTSISPDTRLTSVARLNLTFLVDGERLIPFELSRGLKVSSVQDENGRPLDFFQNSLLEADEVARRGNDLIYVLLHRPTQAHQPVTLTFRYAGDVISNLGNGIYFVGARGTWYPNHGLSDAAIYHLVFHYPSSMTLVATGSRVRESTQGATKTSEWTSDIPIGVAGFNYGDYLSKSRNVNAVNVEVFANRGLEQIVANLQARLDQIRVARLAALQQQQQAGSRMPFPLAPPDPVVLPTISTQSLLTNVIDDSGSALTFLESWFGPYPYKKLALSQIPGHFGQGWPSLCYVSTFTFLTREQQTAMGLTQDNQFLFSRLMRAHEIAHQWWGNLITPESYHDIWLMEGMANYAARLYAAGKDSKEKDFLDEMEQLKQRLETKTKDGLPVESAGPIWLGWRLYSSKTPTGYQDIVYDKGAWVIHMLRMMMQDERTGSDERFIEALKSFLAQHRNQSVTTEDFKEALEPYMTPLMNLDGGHTLGWFFDEWVYDVGIPEYRLSYSIAGSFQKGYFVSGRIFQSGVPSTFEMPVPIFAHYANRAVPLGHVHVSGHETYFRFHLRAGSPRPSKITLNDNGAVLCNIKGK